MGLLEKFKNIFTEEVEEEVEVPVKKDIHIKKDVPKVEIPTPAPIKKEVIKREEIKVEEDPIKASNLSLKKEEKFVFPVYFDDKDFEDIKKEEPKPVKKMENKPLPEQKKGNYQEAYKEVYNKINKESEEKKVFKPTPIISPVYGILDKNYYKEDIVVSKPVIRPSYTSSKEITIDDVRKKAFGTLEDDLENTLLSDENLNSEPKHAKNEDENNSNSDIFDEMDFANAIEEDRKRDMTKDGLKSDIEALLNNKEFMEEFSYHLSSIKKDKEEQKEIDNLKDDGIDKEDTVNDKKEEKIENPKDDLIINDSNVEDNTTIDDLYDENKQDVILPKEDETKIVESKDDDNKDLSLDEDELYDIPSNISVEDNDETLDDLYNVKTNISDDSEDEIDNAYNSSSDLNDSDLFNLIDSMYDKENK